MMNPNSVQNPLFQLMEMARNGVPAIQAIQQIATQGNPQMQRFFNTIKGKSSQQLRQMAENVAKERDTTVQDVAHSLGLRL